MIKVAFFAQALFSNKNYKSEYAAELIKSISSTNVVSTVFTSYELNSEGTEIKQSNIRILRPFTKWTWFEALRITPMFFKNPPHISFFIYENLIDLKSWRHANQFVVQFFQTTTSTINCAVIMETNPRSFTKALARQIDYQFTKIFAIDPKVARRLEKLHPPIKNKLVSLPFFPKLDPQVTGNWIGDELENYLTIPVGSLSADKASEVFDVLQNFAVENSRWSCVFLGGWENINSLLQDYYLQKLQSQKVAHQFVFLNNLTLSQQYSLMQSSNLVVLNWMRDRFDVHHLLQKSSLWNIPAILNSEHIHSMPIDAKSHSKYLVTKNNKGALFEKLHLFANDKSFRKKLNTQVELTDYYENQDEVTNIINRELSQMIAQL